MEEIQKDNTESPHKDNSADASLLAGGALGAVAAGELVLLGTACPLCVVGAPLLLGYGAYKKYKEKKNMKSNKDSQEK
ncbi:hypothetical protein GF362_03830 [Candidatus Dojkabacteria bacterium]|nr:hypothetical protein [Candidatus Dojkabacteria bacterium]